MDKSLTICLITKEYKNENGSGGIASYFRNLAQLLSKQNKVLVITYGESRIEKQSPNLEIHYLKFHGFANPILNWLYYQILRKILRRKRLLLYTFEWIFAVKNYLKQLLANTEIDIFEVPDSLGYGIALGNQKYLVKLHTPNEIVFRLNHWPVDTAIKIIGHIEKTAIKRAALILSPSMAMIDYLNEQKWVRIQSNYRVIRNPIILNHEFERSETEEENIILFMGNYQLRKGIETIIAAFLSLRDEIPGYRLVLCGKDDGVFQHHQWYSIKEMLIQKYAINSASNIEFTDFLPKEALNQYIQKAKVVVVPSLEFENYPMVILEAMIEQKAVIAGKCGGIVEMIEDGKTGRLFDKNNYQELAQKLMEVLTDDHHRIQMGLNAREWIKNEHNEAKIYSQMMEAYREAIIK